MIWPPILDLPSITIRSGDIVHDGWVQIQLSPGEPTVLLDGAHLTPAEARALSLALGDAYSAAIELPRYQMPVERRQQTPPNGSTVGALITGGVLTLYLLAGDDARKLWCGPIEHALSLMGALTGAGDGALAIADYAQRPVFVISPVPPEHLC